MALKEGKEIKEGGRKWREEILNKKREGGAERRGRKKKRNKERLEDGGDRDRGTGRRVKEDRQTVEGSETKVEERKGKGKEGKEREEGRGEGGKGVAWA